MRARGGLREPRAATKSEAKHSNRLPLVVIGITAVGLALWSLCALRLHDLSDHKGVVEPTEVHRPPLRGEVKVVHTAAPAPVAEPEVTAEPLGSRFALIPRPQHLEASLNSSVYQKDSKWS